MIKSAQNRSVSELLSIDANWKFVVPRYQREYVWRRDNWEKLFDDLWDNPPGYFLGSMICINRADDAMQIQDLELVDGQQRLATLSILYAAIHSCLLKCELQDEDAKHELYNLRYRLVFKGQKKDLRVVPSYQGQNYMDYCAILQDAGILSNVDVRAKAGNRRLFKAYRFFIERLDELDKKGERIFDPEQIQILLDRVNQSSLVKIEVASHADAFTLFESLNNRGVPLSALDLIKNNLLAVLEKKAPNSINENFTKWNRLLENISDDSGIQERYLRQYYNAFKYKKEISVQKVSLATRSNIIHIYDKLIDRDAEWFFNDLFEKARLYNKFIMPLSDGVPPILAEQLQGLHRIGGAPAYTLLLYLLAEHPNANLPGVCEFLVRYFVRRNLTDIPPTRDLARIFIGVIDALNAKPEGEIFELVHQSLLKPEMYAPDAVFKNKLSGNIYDENADATRFILCLIEEERQTREKLTDLWERDDKGDFIWTVEHIFPQGPNIPEEWIKMIANGDETQAKEYREKYVHKIGNLTISGYNSKLGNKSFNEKRDRIDNKGRFVGYRNGLFLNQMLKEKSIWTVKDIEDRTNALVDLSMDLFKL
jgi:hypothetical protein